MGIPKFFSNIFEKYPKSHFVDKKFRTDVLLMDYNGFIYTAYGEYFKQLTYEKFSKLTKSKREEKIVDFIIKKTLEFVNEEVKPQEMLYIAIDGTVPRGKINESRFRRYNAIKLQKYKEELSADKTLDNLFPGSVNITPGSTFMSKLSDKLKKTISDKKFMNGKIKVIFSGASVSGEGEHKILPYLRSLKNTKKNYMLFSPDGDMIVLGLQLNLNLFLIKEKDKKKRHEVKFYPDEKYFIFSFNSYKEFLQEELKMKDENNNLFNDIVFLTFFIGNDFIRPITFLKSNKWGVLTIVFNIYKNVKRRHQNSSLVNFDGDLPKVNYQFLRDMIYQFSQREDSMLKREYEGILKKVNQEPDETKYENTPTIEEKSEAYEHANYYLPYFIQGNIKEEYKIIRDNPNYQEGLHKTIDYSLEHDKWKLQYYSYYFDINIGDGNEYHKMREVICMKYLESLVYCLQYYLVGVPSWKWYYPFRAAPLPSDILYFMRNKSLDFKFKKSKPFTPLQQYMMVLPYQNIDLLPKQLQDLITDLNYPFYPYYPTDFKIDFLLGKKFVYAKPILPDFDDKLFESPIAKKKFKEISKTNKNRDILDEEPFVFEDK